MSSALVILQGRLAADPEIRLTPTGTKHLKVSIPIDQGWGDKKTTGWYNVTVWGTRADQIEKAMDKGMFRKDQQVFVSGILTQRSYTTNSGESRTSLDVDAKTFEPVLMPRDQAQSSEDRPTYTGSTSPQSWPEKMEQEGFDDMGSVPF